MKIIAGVDEVGRGSLIGPVYAAAVILNKNIKINSIWAIGKASKNEVDKINILQASLLAMKRAIKKLKKKPSYVLVDGNKIPVMNNYKMKAIIKGDTKIPAISAASIIAKVARDNFIILLSKKNKGYYWEKNFGYGTRQHLKALTKLGITKHHRKTFSPVAKISKHNIWLSLK